MKQYPYNPTIKALIFTGKEELEKRTVESYQLLVNLEYVTGAYDGSEDRDKFYEELSDVFAEKMLDTGSDLELGLYNGVKINTETHKPESICELEEGHITQLTEKIRTKLQDGIVGIVVAAPNDN